MKCKYVAKDKKRLSMLLTTEKFHLMLLIEEILIIKVIVKKILMKKMKKNFDEGN